MDLKPTLQELWLADNVEQDSATGKITVSNLFDLIEVEHEGDDFTSRAFLFFGVRGVRSETHFSLCYVDLADEAVLEEIRFVVRGDDPLQTIVRAMRVARMPVPHAGSYVWELRWSSEPIGTCRVTALVSGGN